ncbi:MAG: hypothetical protein WEA61_07635 [Anaerolineales bacterium]
MTSDNSLPISKLSSATTNTLMLYIAKQLSNEKRNSSEVVENLVKAGFSDKLAQQLVAKAVEYQKIHLYTNAETPTEESRANIPSGIVLDESLFPERPNIFSPSYFSNRKSHWSVPFLFYGALSSLPIPCINWVWLILGVREAIKLGWPRGIYGIGILILTAFFGKLTISVILGLSGLY